MQEYRLYVVDGAELHWPREIEARDDAATIAVAREHCTDGRRMELWERHRKVHCWGFPDCPSKCEQPRAH